MEEWEKNHIQKMYKFNMAGIQKFSMIHLGISWMYLKLKVWFEF